MTADTRPAFSEQLQKKWAQGKFLCVGLDADMTHPKFPQHLLEQSQGDRYEAQWRFVKQIIERTHDIVCAYKPNMAFFEDHPGGEEALENIVELAHKHGVPVIGDGKRADIGNTNRGYAQMAFERYGFDAITTNPYLGHGTYKPFLDHEGKGLIALCKTSNPDAALYQDLDIHFKMSMLNGTITKDEVTEIRRITRRRVAAPLYWLVAYRHGRLADQNPNIGVVVGATYPEAFAPVRKLFGEGLLLVPGIGTQGGDLEATLKHALTKKRDGIVINSSSSIIFASPGEDFDYAARAAAIKLDNQIRDLREAV